MPTIHPLAQELNQKIGSALDFFSEIGRALYFPSKGILAQSAEAKEKAKKFNATIGIATSGPDPLVLPSLAKYFQGVTKAEIFNYAPSFGLPALRQAWKERLTAVNPSLQGKTFSLPLVTSGITHGLSLVSDLFCGEDDLLLIPDQLWEYRLIFEVRKKTTVQLFPFFEGAGFNFTGLEAILSGLVGKRKKVAILLNFPNNPTGYSLTKKEAPRMAELLERYAAKGLKTLVILDDAYTGLFFDEEVEGESLFPRLANIHENLLAVKLDGMTKEYFAWGFRVGFMTYGIRGGTPEIFTAFENKTAGAIRGSVSNASAPAQSLSLRALKDPAISGEARANFEILKARALRTRAVLADGKYDSVFKAYPFNSGYFMLIRLKELSAEKLRVHLLDKHGVGTIATSETDLRVAFSCVEEKDIAELFEIIFKAGKELAGR